MTCFIAINILLLKSLPPANQDIQYIDLILGTNAVKFRPEKPSYRVPKLHPVHTRCRNEEVLSQ